ncbi:MAG TPA: hypothetical protein VFA63_02685, partial [Pseudonocardiaceae bacterium]|nr:hypothetical protein [Pseudonocardiaceae bacterium]
MRGFVSGAASLSLSAGLLVGTAYAHPEAAHGVPPVPTTPSAPVSPIVSNYQKPAPAPNMKTIAPTWPSGSADVRLPAAQQSTARAGSHASTSTASPAPATVRAGTLPVWIVGGAATGLTAPVSAHVSIASKTVASKAGINGVLLSAARTDDTDT